MSGERNEDDVPSGRGSWSESSIELSAVTMPVTPGHQAGYEVHGLTLGTESAKAPRKAPPRRRHPGRGRGRPRIQERRSSRTGQVYLYGDFRAYADVGGRVEPLRAPGDRRATSDPATAARLYAERATAYASARRAAELTRGGAVPAPPSADAAERRPEEAGCTVPSSALHSRAGAEVDGGAVMRLGPMTTMHLERKAAARSGRRASTIRRDGVGLAAVRRHFGDDCRLDAITPAALDEYVLARERQPGVRPGTRVSPHTIRNELHALSNLYRRAVAMGHAHENPVARMVEKPAPPIGEADVLTTCEAARLLDASAALDAETRVAQRAAALRRQARALGDGRKDGRVCVLLAEARQARRALRDDDWVGPNGRRRPAAGRYYPWLEAVIATLLYTGGRITEILGLLFEDIDFARGRVLFRPNHYRRLKRDRHRREVELWPPLAAILRHHLAATGIREGLLFPARGGGLLSSFPKMFRRCVARARLGGAGRRVTPHTLRHTFATNLLQTLVLAEGGRLAVRSSFDVAKRLGHRSSALVDALYGHQVADPHYADALSYEEHRTCPTSRLTT